MDLKAGLFVGVVALACFAQGEENHDHTVGAHWEPQIAMLCGAGEKFINKRMDDTGKWVTDWEHKASCIQDKVDILEYCRKVYPDKDITNIVEGTDVLRIENWCPVNSLKCRKYAKVKSVRCLSGPFQSDALLVPHGCQFDHVHNASQCLGPEAWRAVAERSCTQRSLELRSHAMLLPCGVDVFQGVEFVCCPHDAGLKDFNTQNELDTGDDDDTDDEDDKEDPDDEDDDEDDDDEDDEEDDDAESTSSTSSTTTENPYLSAATPDPYLTNFDPENEREEFLAAKERMEKHHESRVSKVMKDWGVMEEKYQDMKIADPEKAEKYRKEMTAKFQQRVNILEAEGEAEKQQIVSMHQQRILRSINNRKREALQCYQDALNQRVPSLHKVEKCLQRLLRALHKDRHHSLAHYRHLLNTNFDEAERQREVTFERLMEVDRTVNQSLDMLNKFPELQRKLRPLMDQFADALRTKQNFADFSADGATFQPNSKLLSRTMDSEKETMDLMRDRALVKKKVIDDRKRREEEMRKQKWAAHMKKKQEQERLRQKKLKEVKTTPKPVPSTTAKPVIKSLGEFDLPEMGKDRKEKVTAKKFDPLAVDDDRSLKGSPVVANHFEDDEEKAHLQEHVAEEIPVAHAQAHELSHSQSSYLVVPRAKPAGNGSKAAYVTVAFAGLALMTVMVLTIVVLRRRNVASPQRQGFVEVDQSASPEERHIANMQINGYENPTYKYFEETDT